VCVLLEFLQKTWAIPIMNPLSWFMILLLKYLLCYENFPLDLAISTDRQKFSTSKLFMHAVHICTIVVSCAYCHS